MRIKLKFSQNTSSVPNNQMHVNSYIHESLGKNEYHDKHSDYCISRMLGGKVIDGGKFVDYPNGGYVLVTSAHVEFIDNIIKSTLSNPDFGFGMKLIDIEHIVEEFYGGDNWFRTTDMGFLLKDKSDNGYTKYHTINDEDINEVLRNHIVSKLSKIDSTLNLKNLTVNISTTGKRKVEKRYCKNVMNIVNICNINVNTNKRVAEAIYNYGIGSSTGSGFGTVYTTQFNEFYK